MLWKNILVCANCGEITESSYCVTSTKGQHFCLHCYLGIIKIGNSSIKFVRDEKKKEKKIINEKSPINIEIIELR